MIPTSRLFTCRHCGVQIPALIPLGEHLHRVLTALLIRHLSHHPDLSRVVVAPPLRQDEILPRLLKTLMTSQQHASKSCLWPHP